MKIVPFPGKINKSKSLGTPYVLTEEQVEWLRRYYPNNATGEIGKIMGLARTSVTRIAQRLGIAKDRIVYPQRLREIQLKIIESERRRDRWGLPRRTNLYLPRKAYTKKEIRRRWTAKRRWGYIPGDSMEERYIIFYDEHTKRNRIFEHYCIKNGFRIEERKKVVYVLNQDNDGT